MNDTTLNQLPLGGIAAIVDISNPPSMKRRLLDLGFIPGTQVQCVLKSRHAESAAFLLRETIIALRKEDSALIHIHNVGKPQGQRNVDESQA